MIWSSVRRYLAYVVRHLEPTGGGAAGRLIATCWWSYCLILVEEILVELLLGIDFGPRNMYSNELGGICIKCMNLY
ncbi:hypothetical protein I3842_Q095800 [Carya illinoinensis]|uniref:Uncharacterized protein n=1 Tax=Carya illinoinensis TaxID=32201 RepID=A0A922A191_CARIL|nr:hypothetical protein I3842_Q095800 [Carya illinoinensis]